MTSSNQQITRCPKCGTAFRITQAQLQSANGAVRCGSCLNVFKAVDYLVAPSPQKAAATPANNAQSVTSEARTKAVPTQPPMPSQVESSSTAPQGSSTKVANPSEVQAAETKPDTSTSMRKEPGQLAILSSIKPLPVSPPPAIPLHTTSNSSTPQKPVVRVLDKSSLDQIDDILISDDMDDVKTETKSYEFDSFLDIDVNPKAEVSLFERKIRDQEEQQESNNADESWAEMLIENEDDDTPSYKTRSAIIEDEEDFYASQRTPEHPTATSVTPKSDASPSLMFSLVEEPAPQQQTPLHAERKDDDDFVLSDELANIPDHDGFKPTPTATDAAALDPGIFETPDTETNDDSPKRQVKTQPKIRAYDGSRTALLMNIIPAPIEFTSKRMRRWYQRKLWPTLSLLTLIALVVQLGWFKFDYFSRVEPYRTAYTFLCPYLGCQVPALIDTKQISAFNLVVREHSEMTGALAVDVMIMNNAPFEQPYPDLVLVFTDINDNEVASRRFTPREYLGGEAVGSSRMERDRPVHLTLDLVDPGEQAVNYNIYIPPQ